MKIQKPLHILLTFAIVSALAACGQSDTDGSTGEALLEVAEQGDLNALDALLARTRQPDARDSCNWTPLMKAALNGHTAVVERLIDAGAEIDAVDTGGYTAMMLAASNNHAEVVDLLLAHGAMVDHQEDTKGWTALIWAAKQGHAKSVETLLRHSADKTLKDFDGKTAAAWASETDRAEIANLLEDSAQSSS